MKRGILLLLASRPASCGGGDVVSSDWEAAVVCSIEVALVGAVSCSY